MIQPTTTIGIKVIASPVTEIQPYFCVACWNSLSENKLLGNTLGEGRQAYTTTNTAWNRFLL